MAQQNKSLPIGFGAQNPLCSWLSWREAGWWVKWSCGMQICSENTSQARRQVTLWYFCLYCFTKGFSSLPSGSPRASPSISWFSISSSGEAGGENPVDLWGPVSYRHSLSHSCMGGSCLVHEGVYSTQLHHQPLPLPYVWNVASCLEITQQKADVRTPGPPTSRNHGGEQRTPEGHGGVTTGPCCLLLVPSLLFSHNPTVILGPESLPPSTVPLLCEHSASANLVPFMKLLLATTTQTTHSGPLTTWVFTPNAIRNLPGDQHQLDSL